MKRVMHSIPLQPIDAEEFLDVRLSSADAQRSQSDDWIAALKSFHGFVIPGFAEALTQIDDVLQDADGASAKRMVRFQFRANINQITWRTREYRKDDMKTIIKYANRKWPLTFDAAVTVALSVNHVLRNRLSTVDEARAAELRTCMFGPHSIRACVFFLYDGYYLYETAQRLVGNERDLLREISMAAGQPRTVIRALVGEQVIEGAWTEAGIDVAAPVVGSYATVSTIYRHFAEILDGHSILAGKTEFDFVRRLHAGCGRKEPVEGEWITDAQKVTSGPYGWPAVASDDVAVAPSKAALVPA